MDSLEDRQRLGLLLVFTALYGALIATPALAHAAFPLRRDLEWGDLADLLTPLLLLSFVWILVGEAAKSSRRALAAVFVIALVWTEGHGLHLAANAINHHVDNTTPRDLARVTDFLDERLSHYVWQSGALAVPALFLITGRRGAAGRSLRLRSMTVVLGGVWGVTLALDAIESVVVPLALPVFSVLLLGTGIDRWRASASADVHLLYYFAGAACLSAVLLLAGWGAAYGGWPELSDVGLI